MNTVTWLYPAKSCPLPYSHPARATMSLEHTDVCATFKLYDVGDIRDDYQRVQEDDWLSAPGGFK